VNPEFVKVYEGSLTGALSIKNLLKPAALTVSVIPPWQAVTPRLQLLQYMSKRRMKRES
jgi:hypothetical protein